MKNVHLSPPDFRTPVWQNVVKVVTQRIDELRTQLETLDATEQQTAIIRGRISELRALLALGEPPKNSVKAAPRAFTPDPDGSP